MRIALTALGIGLLLQLWASARLLHSVREMCGW